MPPSLRFAANAIQRLAKDVRSQRQRTALSSSFQVACFDEYTIVNSLRGGSTAGAKVSTVQLSAWPNRNCIETRGEGKGGWPAARLS